MKKSISCGPLLPCVLDCFHLYMVLDLCIFLSWLRLFQWRKQYYGLRTEVTVWISNFIYYKHAIPLHGNFELRPLGDTMGNASSVTRAWRNIWKKHHPLAGDSPWRHYRRDHNIRTAGRIHHQLFRLHWLVCLKKRAFW